METSDRKANSTLLGRFRCLASRSKMEKSTSTMLRVIYLSPFLQPMSKQSRNGTPPQLSKLIGFLVAVRVSKAPRLAPLKMP